MPDQILDVDPAVAQRAAVAVRFGDFGGKGHDTLEARNKVVRKHAHEPDSPICGSAA